jgi:hypothetical protein
MFPHISGEKVYRHWGCELVDGTFISGSEELPPDTFGIVWPNSFGDIWHTGTLIAFGSPV